LGAIPLNQLIVIPEGEHFALGPSSSERWLNCPGSTGQGQTEYAAEGTCAHTLSEWVRLSGKPAEHWKGVTLQSGEFQFKVGKGMIDSVNTFVEDVVKEGPGAALVEEKVGYNELVAGGFGTADHARLLDWVCRVKDFKHGKGVVVAAKENTQLMLYALGIYFKYRWIYDFDKFVLSICQPRVHHFDEWEVSLGKLLEWGFDVVRPGALRVHPDAPRVAGPWCKFCGHKNDCPVRAVYKMQHETSTFYRDPSEELVNLEG
jgi:Protein of unknown function (DUF2800)